MSMILVFPEETSITTLLAHYFHELEHFSKFSSYCLTPFLPQLVLNHHPHLTPPHHTCPALPSHPMPHLPVVHASP